VPAGASMAAATGGRPRRRADEPHRMSTVRVMAIVVAFEGGELVERCVDALLASTYHRLDVLVVDNGSSDDAADRIAARGDDRVRVLRLPVNRGFAGGVNAGISHCEHFHAPIRPAIYALVNQDCLPAPGWLGPLVAALLADRRVAVAGCRLLEPDGVTLQHAGGIVHGNAMTDHVGRGSRDPAAFREPGDVDYVTGALCAFRAEAWRGLGPLDEGYHPVYFEEVDFCRRARARGLRVVYVPDSEATHLEAASSGRGSYRHLRYYHRSRMRFLARHLLRRGNVARVLRAELGWLARQRGGDQLRPVLRAYAGLPSEIAAARRERAREPV
jgi:GT2 family glycosyltransferase